ncbi:coiled-coil domain-containing protein 42-like [Cuculus canorus]|uniref:coiled-coil domain-containing protein 42-like n=1 Tax=Cuculus canorus TaxID=55661 RepID=UPI0023AB09D6|nr:coiled-coil domain-containing protein 42-like [Cuculus canorus]
MAAVNYSRTRWSRWLFRALGWGQLGDETETVLADIQDTATKKVLELGTIKLTILKLFRSLSAYRKAHLKVSQDDSLRQLDMIQHFIQDFADLCLEEKQKDRRNSQEGTCGATRDTPAGPALPAEAQQGGK